MESMRPAQPALVKVSTKTFGATGLADPKRSPASEFQKAVSTILQAVQRECCKRPSLPNLSVLPFSLHPNHALARSLEETIIAGKSTLPTQAWVCGVVDTAQHLADSGQFRLAAQCLEIVSNVIMPGCHKVEAIKDALQTLPLNVLEAACKVLLARCQASLGEVLSNDPHLQSQSTVSVAFRGLAVAKAVSDSILQRGSSVAEPLYFLLYDASVCTYAVVEALTTYDAFCAWRALPYLAYALLIVESHTTLASLHFVRWRLQLYGLLCRIYDRCGAHAVTSTRDPPSESKAGDTVDCLQNLVDAARSTCDRGLRAVAALRRLFVLDPPVLEADMALLDQVKAEIAIRKFRYDSMIELPQALASLPKLLPDPAGQVVALLNGISFTGAQLRRTAFCADPGTECQKALKLCNLVLASGTASPAQSDGALEGNRVDTCFHQLMQLLAPFIEAVLPHIRAYAVTYIDLYKSSASKPNDRVVGQGRTRSSLATGHQLRSAMKKQTDSAIPEDDAAKTPVLSFPSCLEAFEASEAARLLPCELHLSLLHVCYSYRKWREFSFFLHALEARAEAMSMLCATDAPSTHILLTCLVLRRLRELSVAVLDVPVEKPVPLVESTSVPPAAGRGKDTGGKATSPSPATPAKKPLTSARDAKAAPSKAVVEKAAEPVKAVEAVKAISLSPSALLSANPGVILETLPVVRVHALVLQTACDALVACARALPRSHVSLNIPGIAVLNRAASQGLSDEHARDLADLCHDGALIVTEVARSLQAWRNAQPVATTGNPSGPLGQVDDILLVMYRSLLSLFRSLPTVDPLVSAEVAMQLAAVSLSRNDLIDAIQAARCGLHCVQAEMNAVVIRRESVEKSSSAVAPRESSLQAMHTDLLLMLFTGECRLAAQRQFLQAVVDTNSEQSSNKPAPPRRRTLRTSVAGEEPDSLGATTSRGSIKIDGPAGVGPQKCVPVMCKWLSCVLGELYDPEECEELVASTLVRLGGEYHGFGPSAVDEARFASECKHNAEWHAVVSIATLPYCGDAAARREALHEISNIAQSRDGSPVRGNTNPTSAHESNAGMAELNRMAASQRIPPGLKSALSRTIKSSTRPAWSQSTRLSATTSPTRKLAGPLIRCVTSTTILLDIPESVDVPAIRYLGKPVGAGTAVAATNTHLDGTGVQLSRTLSAPSLACFVRGLRSNERYHFGYSSNDQVSMTSQTVLAATPLSTTLLWSYAAQQAAELGHHQEALELANKVIATFVEFDEQHAVIRNLTSNPCKMYKLRRDAVVDSPRTTIAQLARCCCLVAELSVDGYLPTGRRSDRGELGQLRRVLLYAIAADLGMALKDQLLIQQAICGGVFAVASLMQLSCHSLGWWLLQPALLFHVAVSSLPWENLQQRLQLAHARNVYCMTTIARSTLQNPTTSTAVISILRLASSLSTIAASNVPAALYNEAIWHDVSVWSTEGGPKLMDIDPVNRVAAMHQLFPGHAGGQAASAEVAFFAKSWMGGPIYDRLIQCLVLQSPLNIAKLRSMELAEVDAMMTSMPANLGLYHALAGITSLDKTGYFLQALSELQHTFNTPKAAVEALIKRHLYVVAPGVDAPAETATSRQVAAKGKEAPKAAGKAAVVPVVAQMPLPEYRREFVTLLVEMTYLWMQHDVGDCLGDLFELIEPPLRRLSEVNAPGPTPLAGYEAMRRPHLQELLQLGATKQAFLLDHLKSDFFKQCARDVSFCVVFACLRPVICACLTEPVTPQAAVSSDAKQIEFSSVKQHIHRALSLCHVETDESVFAATDNVVESDPALLATEPGAQSGGGRQWNARDHASLSWLNPEHLIKLPLSVRENLLALASYDCLRARLWFSRLINVQSSQIPAPSSQEIALATTASTVGNMLSYVWCQPPGNSDAPTTPVLPQVPCAVSAPHSIMSERELFTQSLSIMDALCSAASDAAIVASYAQAWGTVYHCCKVCWAGLNSLPVDASLYGGSNIDIGEAPEAADGAVDADHDEWSSVPPQQPKIFLHTAAQLDWRPLWRVAICTLELLSRIFAGSLEHVWGTGVASSWEHDHSNTPSASSAPIAPMGEQTPPRVPRPSTMLPPETPRSLNDGSQLSDGIDAEGSVGPESDSDGEDADQEFASPSDATPASWPAGFNIDDIAWMSKLVAFACEALAHAQQWGLLVCLGHKILRINMRLIELLGGADAFSQSPNPATPGQGWSGVGAGPISQPSWSGSDQLQNPNAWQAARLQLARSARQFCAPVFSFGLAAIEDSFGQSLTFAWYAAKIQWSFTSADLVAARQQLQRAEFLFSNRPSLSGKTKHRRTSILEQMATIDSEERMFEAVRSELNARIQKAAALEGLRSKALEKLQTFLLVRQRDMPHGRRVLAKSRSMASAHLFSEQVRTGNFRIAFATSAIVPQPVDDLSAPVGLNAVRKLKAARQAGIDLSTMPDVSDVVAFLNASMLPLRKRQDTAVLTQCLMLLASMHLDHGLRLLNGNDSALNREDALKHLLQSLQAWRDALDAIFGANDSLHTYAATFLPDGEFHRQIFERFGVVGCLVTTVVCQSMVSTSSLISRLRPEFSYADMGLLSRNDELELHLLTASMVHASFMVPITLHPRHAFEFSRHRPVEWVPGVEIFADPRMVSPTDLTSSLRAAIKGILSYGAIHTVAALPLCCAYEFLATYRCNEADWLVDCRVLRATVQLELAEYGGAMETIGMLYSGVGLLARDLPLPAVALSVPAAAEVPASKTVAPAKGSKSSTVAPKSDEPKSTDILLSQRHGSCQPVFFNHLPPSHPLNVEACTFLLAPEDDPRVTFSGGHRRLLRLGDQLRIHGLRARFCQYLAASCIDVSAHDDALPAERSRSSSIFHQAVDFLADKGWYRRPPAADNGQHDYLAVLRSSVTKSSNDAAPNSTSRKDAKDVKQDSSAVVYLDVGPVKLIDMLMAAAKRQLVRLFRCAVGDTPLSKESYEWLGFSRADVSHTPEPRTPAIGVLPGLLMDAISLCELLGDDTTALTLIRDCQQHQLLTASRDTLERYAVSHPMEANDVDLGMWLNTRLKAVSLLIRGGAPEEAVELAKQIVQECVHCGDSEVKTQATYLQAVAYLTDGEVAQCAVHLCSILTANIPNKPVASSLRTSALLLQGCCLLANIAAEQPDALPSTLSLALTQLARIGGRAESSPVQALMSFAQDICLHECSLQGVDVAYWDNSVQEWASVSRVEAPLPELSARASVDNIYCKAVRSLATVRVMKAEVTESREDAAVLAAESLRLCSSMVPFAPISIVSDACLVLAKNCASTGPCLLEPCVAVLHALVPVVLHCPWHVLRFAQTSLGVACAVNIIQHVTMAASAELNATAGQLVAAIPELCALSARLRARERKWDTGSIVRAALNMDQQPEDHQDKGTSVKSAAKTKETTAPVTADVFARLADRLPAKLLHGLRSSMSAEDVSMEDMRAFAQASGSLTNHSANAASGVTVALVQQFANLSGAWKWMLEPFGSISQLQIRNCMAAVVAAFPGVAKLFETFSIPSLPPTGATSASVANESMATVLLHSDESDKQHCAALIMAQEGPSLLMLGPYTPEALPETAAKGAATSKVSGPKGSKPAMTEAAGTVTELTPYLPTLYALRTSPGAVGPLQMQVATTWRLLRQLTDSHFLLSYFTVHTAVAPTGVTATTTKGSKAVEPSRIPTLSQALLADAEDSFWQTVEAFSKWVACGKLSNETMAALKVELLAPSVLVSEKKATVKGSENKVAPQCTFEDLDILLEEELALIADPQLQSCARMHALIHALLRVLRDGEGVKSTMLAKLLHKILPRPQCGVSVA